MKTPDEYPASIGKQTPNPYMAILRFLPTELSWLLRVI